MHKGKTLKSKLLKKNLIESSPNNRFFYIKDIVTFFPPAHRSRELWFTMNISRNLARWITYLLTMMDTTVFWFDKKMRFGSLRGRNVDKAALKSGFSVARTSFHGKKLTAIFTLHSDVTVESLLNNAATFNRVCTLVKFRAIWVISTPLWKPT